jgi:ABC-type lipoprotein export system ATPase subunit
MPIISVRDVTRRYKLDELTVIEPVSHISLDIEQGQLTVITGRSGCGKTTLLNLMAGLIRPHSGLVTVEGRDLRVMDDKALSAMRSRSMGFVFQFPSLLPALSVKENVMLPRQFAVGQGGDSGEERALSLLKMVGLGERANVFPRQLSAGEQKRAVIARALINEPKILLADEPTSDLDEKTEQEIMSLLMGIRAAGVTIVMVTHNLQLLAFADRAYHMEDGKLGAIAGSALQGR